MSDFAWRAYRFLEIVSYLHRFISWNESSIARRKRLRMIWKIQVGHKIHVRVDWWIFFFHPRPPWRRNDGSKICLECKITRFFSKTRWVRLRRPRSPGCFYIHPGIPHSCRSWLLNSKNLSETSFSSESGSKICTESKNFRFGLASMSFSWNHIIFTHFYFVKWIPDCSLKTPPNEL